VARKVAAFERPRVLDVCTGTGDLALTVGGEMVGADFCLPMLEKARLKVLRMQRTLPLCAADALHLPFAEATFDVVTVAFGIRNFADLEVGLGELVRVLRPGGVLLVLEFSRPRGPLAPLLGWWVRTVPPRVGRWLSGDAEAYDYLPASVSLFPEGRDMCRKLEGVGLEDVSVRPLTGGVASLYEGTRPLEDIR